MAEVPVQKTESFWDQIEQMEARVKRRAYDISQVTGSIGQDLDNWLRAERELVRKPLIELTEMGNRFEVKVDVAGFDARDLKVEATEEDLLIKAETRTEKRTETGQVHASELAAASLFRSIHFPKRVDPGKVKADLRNGLLTVTAPIAGEAEGRKIKVQKA